MSGRSYTDYEVRPGGHCADDRRSPSTPRPGPTGRTRRDGPAGQIPDPSFDRLIRLAVRSTRVPVALISLVDCDRQFFKGAHGLPEPWATRRETPLSMSFCRHVVELGEPLVIADARQDPQVQDNLAIAELGVVAYLGIPLVAPGGAVLGSFCVIDHEPRAWTGDEVETVRDLAETAAAEIELRLDRAERRRAEEALRHSESRLSRLAESDMIGVMIAGLEGEIREANDAFLRMIGFDRSDLAAGRVNWRAMSPPEYSEQDRRKLKELRDHGTCSPYEKEYIRKDGCRIVVLLGAAIVEGSPDAAICFVVDVTARRQAEETLRLLAEAGVELASAPDYRASLAGVARLAVPRLADWCTIDMVEPDGRLRRLAAAHADSSEPERAGEPWPLDPGDPGATAGPWNVLRTGRPELLGEVSDALLVSMARDEDHLRSLRQAALSSYMAVPLWSRDRMLGVITLAATESGRCYDAEDLAVAEDLARRVALAVDNARLLREAKEAARRAEESLAVLDTLMTTAPVGMAFLDRDLRYVRMNDALAAIDGIDPLRAIGRHVAEVVPGLADSILPLYRRVLESGEPIVGAEVCGETAASPGLTRHWLVNYYPVRTRSGELLGVGVIVADVTERKRAESELVAAMKAAEEASSAKDQFLAVLSHELRTPLTPVLVGVTALLDDPETPASIRPTLEVTRRNVALEARLIDDLLDVTRIGSGKLNLDMVPVNAHGLIAQAIEICRDEIASARLRLELGLSAPEPHVLADPARLQQVVWNLIKNAVKFTPAGGSIAVRSRAGGHGRLVVEVSDSGVGIASEALPKIFNAFEQGGAAVTKQFGGLGLGLAIGKSLVEAQGGRLTAASDGKGRGATFTLDLPTTDAPSSSARIFTESAGTAAPRPEALSILLVEDNADTLRVMSRLLRGRGHRVVTADTVASALESAGADGPFDLLVSDIGLPDGSGLDLMREIRSRGDARGIALSGYGMDGDLRLSREAGFAAHITKPVDFQKLEVVIRQVMAGRGPGGPALDSSLFQI